jgi:heterodisulfide reductase subunit A
LFREARELGILFFRYSGEEKPLVEQGGDGRVRITLKDHVLGIPVELEADYVNLFTAIIPHSDELSKLYKVPVNDDGFFLEAHAKLRPVEFSTDGIFACGLAHYPKPVEESIAQARAAASRAGTLLARKQVEVEPLVSVVDPDKCMGCGYCEDSCSYGAIRLVKIKGKGYRAENLPALCKGCGVCAAGCPQKAIDMIHFRDGQIAAAIQAGGESAIQTKRSLIPEERSFHVVSGYRMAAGDYYHRGHSWVRLEKGGRIRIGIDDFVGKILGPAAEFNLPERGTTLSRDRRGWSLRRNGQRASFLSPMTGKIFSVNEKVLEHPEITLEDPYREGWLLVMEPIVKEGELKRLVRDEESHRWLEEENRKLLELLGPDYERLAATGGEPVVDIPKHFPEMGWDTLVTTFLKTEP